MSKDKTWSFISWNMGMSTISHAKKTDKETQSPMLKIFKEIMQRETSGARDVPSATIDEIEKGGLREKKKKKRKQQPYPSFHSQKSGDSSGVDRIKRAAQYNVAERNRINSGGRTQSNYPFPSEKRDSWWLWESCSRRNGSTSCSCVSCQLKKIFSNEYTCIACLIILFMISVVIAFYLVFRTIALVPVETPESLPALRSIKEKHDLDIHGLGKKMDSMEKDSSDLKKLDNGREMRRSVWDDTVANYGEASFSEEEFNENYRRNNDQLNVNNLRSANELNDLVNAHNMRSASELVNLLDPLRGDPHVSPQLLNFYKKLIEADAQIKHLKKGIYDNQGLENGMGRNTYRLKRSLLAHRKILPGDNNSKPKPKKTKIVAKAKAKKKKIANKKKIVHKQRYGGPKKTPKKDPKAKEKRDLKLLNDTDGIVIEKKRLFIHYLDNKPKFPKCTHCPQDSKSHEHKLKHPFYKNTQRLEELLDQFLDKSLDDMMPDEIGLKSLLNKPKNFNCQHNDPTTKSTEKSTKKTNESTKTKAASTASAHIFTDLFDNYMMPSFRKSPRTDNSLGKRRGESDSRDKVEVNEEGDARDVTETEPSYDILLSVSTMLNKRIESTTPFEADVDLAKLPSRRLLQADDDQEDSVGYEDLKEVLSDDMSGHDESEREIDRKRRSDITDIPSVKYVPPGVVNPNWKGPIPLYPDELSSMMKHELDPNPESSTELPESSSKPSNQYYEANNRKDYSFNDVDYIEDYFSDKYERLAKMAQAYSDYGVLAEKKDVLKSEKGQDKGGKMSAANVRVKKGTKYKDMKKVESEGVTFKVKPYEVQHCDDDLKEFLHTLTKHFRLTDKISESNHKYGGTTLIPVHPGFEIMYTTKRLPQFLDNKKAKFTTLKQDELFNDIVFNKIGRLLKSIAESPSEAFETTAPNILDTNEPSSYDTTEASIHDTSAASPDLTTFMPDEIEDSIIILNYNATNPIAKRSVNDSTESNTQPDTTQENTQSIYDETSELTPEYLKNVTVHIISYTDHSTGATESLTHFKQDKMTIEKEKDMGPSEFLKLLSNWFNTLAGLTASRNVSSNANSQSANITSTLPVIKTANNTNDVKRSTDVIYPMYDSDMIDNIGHRSRVLMSVEEDHSNMTESDAENVSEKTTEMTETTEAPTQLSVNSTENSNETKTGTTVSDAQENAKLENKSLVKRSAADDSKLVFWNDIYDEEYGVKVDPLDETVRDKNSKRSDLVKKSAVWIQDKMKKMSDSIKKRSRDGINRIYRMNEGDSRNVDDDGSGYPRENLKVSLHKISKRGDSNLDGNALDKKAGIAMLTAHMQDVCSQASRAVQKTRNIKQHENPESDIASGLMQHLVKLMTELVDFEVQQKTCVKLPKDLKDFLDWLTNPPPDTSNAQTHSAQNEKNSPPEESGMSSDPLLDIPTTPSSEKEDEKADVRSECLGTLLAVQDLMQEFSQLSDEDKSKMGGVKEYLEDQLEFLNKQLNSVEEMNLGSVYSKSYMPYRLRRDLSGLKATELRQRRLKQIEKLQKNRRVKRKLRRFMKAYVKKHTRTTPSNFESLQVSTEIYSRRKFDDHKAIVGAGNDKIQEPGDNVESDLKSFEQKRQVTNVEKHTEETKRNLNDVYYKAVADAKKVTTVKNLQNKDKDYNVLDKATIASHRV